MTTELQTVNADTLSKLVLKGDISSLNPTERVEYYAHVCKRLGLDPATQPFQILKLQGRETLYATKSAAEQLTRLYHVSHEIRDRQTVNDVFVVYCRAIENGGRFVDSSGAVNIANLKGDALANALMKAETKAKRRATLSLLGLGMLDETEIETIPNAQPIPTTPVPQIPNAVTKEAVQEARSAEQVLVEEIVAEEAKPGDFDPPSSPAQHRKITSLMKKYGMAKPAIVEIAKRRYNKETAKDLTRTEADDLIEFIPKYAESDMMPFDIQPFKREAA